MAIQLQKNPQYVQGFIYAVLAIVLLSLSWLTVVARLAARFSIESLGLDDGFSVLAQLAMTVFSIAALGIHSVITGPTSDTARMQEEAAAWLIVIEASFSLGMIFLKISLGAFFLRLIQNRNQRLLIYGAMILSFIINFYIFWISIFACGAKTEKLLMADLLHQCVPKTVLMTSGFVQAATNTATDFTFGLVPFFLLRGSQLPTRVKIYVGGILVLALTGCIASIVRFWFISQLFSTSANIFHQMFRLGIVGLMELSIGIIASSTATLRPLFKGCAGCARTLAQRSSRKSTTHRSGSSETTSTIEGPLRTSKHDTKLSSKSSGKLDRLYDAEAQHNITLYAALSDPRPP